MTAKSGWLGGWANKTGGAGSGTVTTVSVTSANGFGGTVANPTTTPAITLTTSITGVLKGNATAISAATAGTDYTTPTGAESLTNKVISASTIDGSTIGGVTPAAGTFTSITGGTELAYKVTASAYPTITPSLLFDFANTKALDPRITFTRASTGAFYDGNTVLAEQNLLKYSQDQSNAAWSAVSSTATANSSTAPDGTSTATKLVAAAANTYHYVSQSISSTVSGVQYTVSAYFAAAGYGFACLQSTAGGINGLVCVNLSTGATTTPTSGSVSVVTLAGGWYRVSLTLTTTSTASGSVFIYPASTLTNDPTFLGDGTSGIYLWGAQLEQRSSATVYTPTTTAPITNYIPVLRTAAANVARFDTNPITGESLGLLIEESRTNLLNYSSQFDNAAWTKTNATITTAADVAPDGTLTAQKFTPDATNNNHLLTEVVTTTAVSTTLSIYCKYAGVRYIFINAYQTANHYGYFDIQNGLPLGVDAGTTSQATSVGNGWYRCSITFTADASANTNIRIFSSIDGTSTSYTGNGFSGILIWGAQLEAGAFPTSYIPCPGASQVTRAADSASMTGTNFSSWYNPNTSSLYVESAPQAVGTGTGGWDFASITNAGGTVGLELYKNSASSVVSIYTGTATAANGNVAANTYSKLCVVQNGIVSGIGANNGSVSSSTTPTAYTATQLNIGNNPGVVSRGCYIKRISYYPVALSSANIQALTTL